MNSDNKKKVGAVLGYVREIVQALIAVLYIPLLLRCIGKSEYGLYQIIGSAAAVLNMMETALSSAVVRYYARSRENGDLEAMQNTLALGRRVFRLFSVGMLVLILPVSILIRLAYGAAFSDWELWEAQLLFAILMVDAAIRLNANIYLSALTASESFVFLRLVDIATNVTQAALLVITVQFFPYAWVVVACQLVMNAIRCFLQWRRARKEGAVVRLHQEDRALMKGIATLAFHVLVVTAADQVFLKTDAMILGAYYGTQTAAIYSVGSQINEMYFYIGGVLNGVILPTIIRLMPRGNDPLEKLFRRLGRYQSFLCGLILTGVAAFGQEFLLILSGPGYEEAYPVALLLMVPYTVDIVQMSGCAILQARNRYHYRSRMMLIICAANIVLTLILARIVGILGAAIATTLTIGFGDLVIMNRVYRRDFGLDLPGFLKDIAPIWGTAALTFAASFAIRLLDTGNAYLTFAIHVALYSLLYAAVMYAFIMRPYERANIRRLLSAGRLN